MKMPYVLITALAALTLFAGSTVAVRAQTSDWTDWVKTDVDGITTSNRCTRMAGGRGNGGKDFIIARFHNGGTSDFTGWWSVSYNGSHPTAKKNESSHQKIVVKAGATVGGSSTRFEADALCTSSASINVGQ